MGVSRYAVLRGPGHGRAETAPPARVRSTEGREGWSPGVRHRASGHLPFAEAPLRDASARGWIRHSDDSGTARTSGCEHDHDLHPCPEPGRAGRSESTRPSRTKGRPPTLSYPATPAGVSLLSRSAYPASLEWPIPRQVPMALGLPNRLNPVVWRATLRPSFDDRDIELNRLLVSRMNAGHRAISTFMGYRP